MKLIAPVVLSVLVVITSSAVADDTLARFKGGIGVLPVSSGQGTATTATVVNRNIVRNVQPAGQPWVIGDLDATVKTDGTIQVRGRGLLIAGSNNIGTTVNASVFASLLCAVNASTFSEHNTAAVPLAPNGDFVINDLLSPAPAACSSPTLLIRNAGNLAWFAAGIPAVE